MLRLQRLAGLERESAGAASATRDAEKARKALQDALGRMSALEQQLRDSQSAGDAQRASLAEAQARVVELEQQHAADEASVRELKEGAVRQVGEGSSGWQVCRT